MKIIAITLIAAVCISSASLVADCSTSSCKRSSNQTCVTKKDIDGCSTSKSSPKTESACRAMRISSCPVTVRNDSQQVNEKIAALEAKIAELQQQLTACYVTLQR